MTGVLSSRDFITLGLSLWGRVRPRRDLRPHEAGRRTISYPGAARSGNRSIRQPVYAPIEIRDHNGRMIRGEYTVWGGLRSAIGLSMQIGVVMVVDLDEAFHRRVRRDRPPRSSTAAPVGAGLAMLGHG